MIWKRYRNEMIVLASIVIMLIAMLYKNSAVRGLDATSREVKASTVQIAEIIALKKQWGNENLTKKVGQIKKSIAQNKIKQFSIKSKKLSASFVGLSDMEVNKIILNLENLAVQIVKLSVKRQEGSYRMEIKCKW